MQYVTTFPQMNSGSALSLIRSWARGATLLLIFSAAAAAMSSCNMSGGPASTSDSNDPSTLAPGTINYARNPAYYPYGSAITPNVLNSTGTITSASISPALPTGLTFNTVNGTITGTPTTMTAAQAYTVRATNAQGTSYVTLNLAVTDQPPVMTYTLSKTLVFIKNGSAISDIIPDLAGGAVTTCNASPALPAGLTVDSQCKISGTPTAVAAAKNYTITASNSGGSSSLVFNFTVKDIAPFITYTPSGNSFLRGQAIAAWTPNSTGGTVVSCSSSPALPSGLALSSTCQITGTPTATQSSTAYTITATNSGGTHSTGINIDVQEPAPNISYVPNSRTITKGQASTINVTNPGGVPNTCSADIALPAGLSIASNCNITGTPTVLTSGWTGNITAANVTGSSNTTLIINVVDVPPNISYSGSPYTFNAEFPITTQTPTNTGGPITSCSASPALPAGLTISNTTCAISGTPTTAQAATSYTITASNSGGSRTATISIRVQTVAPSITYAGSPYTYTKGTLITNATPTNPGGTPTTCTASPTLPAGLSISNTCVISGTPTSVATATNYTVTATNAGGSTTGIVNITVKDVLPSFSYSGGPFVYTNGTSISTMTPTNTGGAIVSCSSSPTLPAGLSLANDCVITGTPSVPVAQAIYTISGTNSGGTATASVDITVNDVAPTISYTGSPFNYTKGSAISALSPTVTGGTPTSCTASPTLPTGLSLSNTCVLTGTPTTLSGATDYTITATNSGGSSSDTINISVTSLAPIIVYSGGPYVFTKGTAITDVTPTNSGGAINGCTSDTPLPLGLNLAPTTCIISGTPTEVKAATTYTITATNSNGSSSTTINITSNDAAPAIDYIPTSYSFTYNKGTTITPLTPNNNGGAITSCTTSPALPAGLSINSTTCTISGTPSGIQTSTVYSITASNTGGSSSATITITVNDAAPVFNYSGGPFSTTVNTAMSTLTPTSTGGAITACSASPGLPGGVSLSNTCVISGTPTVVTPATNYTITATNTGGSISTTINLQIKDVAPTLNYTGSPFTYTQGVTITDVNPVTSGGAITSCSSSPTLPTGLILSSTCVISGASSVTVTATNYTITASNSGGSASKTISITVNPGPPVLSYSGSPYAFVKNTSIGTVNPINSGGAITSCASSPGLPAGLALSADCIITGTPLIASSATNYTITGTNSQGSSNYTISIKVDDSAPSIGFTPSTYVETLRTTITNINPSNSGGAITSCTSSPTLPAGLNLSSSCVISGTPTSVSAATDYTITASNIFGSASAIVNIKVKNLPKIVFYSRNPLNGATNGTPTGSSNIWTVTVDGIDKVALTQNTLAGRDSETPNFSPDGANITYHSKRALDGSTNGTATSSFNLWNMLSNGTSAIHPTSNTSAGLNSTSPVSDPTSSFPVNGDESPRFSPDGTKIVFASKMALNGSANGTATNSYNIWVANADGTGLTHLTANTFSNRDSIQPVFGPSNSVVYFVSKTAQNGFDNSTATSSYNVWKVNTDGTGRTPLTAYTSSGYDCYDVSVSPDGTTLAYASHAYTSGSSDSNINIWTIGTNGANNTRLTSNSTGVRDSRYPSYSPDGSEIVFSSLMRISGFNTSSYNIWKMDSNGANQVALTTNTSSGSDSIYPVFSPDNTKIVFTSTMDIGVTTPGSYNIWVMNSDGTSQNYLTANTNSGLDSLLGPGRVWFAE